MHRSFYLLLALAFVIAGCARTEPMMDADMQRDAAQRTAIDGDMLAGASASNTIVENAMAVGELSTLVRAVQAAGLAETLSGPGPFTVFAPLNSAFDLVDADDMLAMEMDDDAKMQLAELLKSHVVDGKVMFGELTNGQVVEAMNGSDYTVSFRNNSMLEKQINEADIVAYDIESSNGVIHVINLVLDDEGFFSQQ